MFSLSDLFEEFVLRSLRASPLTKCTGRLSLKAGTGNVGMGMGNGERVIFKMGNL